MPLVMICGFPCSGKTRIAHLLAEYLSQHADMKVVLINDESLLLKRNEAYKDSAEEKNTRGLLKEAVDRNLAKNTIVICDSLNYIKGFRYQQYCSARSGGTPTCAVWCDETPETVRAWNKEADIKESDEKGVGAPRWNEKLLDELIMRFEPPSDTRRWESPLFIVSHDRPLHFEGVLAAVTSKEVLPINLATQTTKISDTNYLHELDRVTTELVKTIMQLQNQVPLGSPYPVPNTTKKIINVRVLSMADLQKLKRTFLSLNRSLSSMASSGRENFDYGDQTATQIASAFVDFFNSNMNEQ